MNTIEIQKTVTETKKVKVKLPYCTKSESGLYYNKVVSPEKTIRIEPSDVCIKTLSWVSTQEIEITEQEFNAKFIEVLNMIQVLNS